MAWHLVKHRELRETGCKDMHWIQMVNNKVQWRTPWERWWAFLQTW